MMSRLLALFLFMYALQAHPRAEMRYADEPLAPELILQTGHSKVVQAVVWGPGNAWLASGSFDSTIKIWDVESGRELRSLVGHTGAVKALACSADGKWLVSGGNDAALRIWDVERGVELRSVSLGESTIDSIAISPDGKRIAAGGTGTAIIFVDAAAGTEISRLEGHSGPIMSLAFSRDGAWLASGSADKTVKIWDLAKGKLARTLKTDNGEVRSLSFDAAGETLALGSTDKTITVWKVSNGRKLATLTGLTGNALALNYLADGKLTSIDSDRSTTIWDVVGKGRLVSGIKAETGQTEGEAESAVFSAGHSMIAIGNGAGTVTISDAASGKTIYTLENRTAGHYGAGFSLNGQWLASASFDNSVKLWDLQTGRSLSPLRGHTGRVTAVVFHPDSTSVISASVDKTIRLWDIVSGRATDVLTGHTNSISGLAVSKDGKMLVSGSADETVGLWDLEKKGPPRSLRGHKGEVISVAISENGQRIVSSGIDGTIRIWNTRTGQAVRVIEPSTGEIDAVAFSPNGELIASGGVDKTLRIWNAETGVLVRTLAGHAGKINSVAFSADGKQLASTAQDKTVRVWDAATGQEFRTLTGHAGAVFGGAFSNDGKFISSASDDGSVIIWKADEGNRLATLIALKATDDWLVVSPEGFFDGSPDSWGQLSWRFEKSTFNVKPVEVFFNEFYSPGLLADLLGGGKLPSTSNISVKDRRQPQLKLTLVENDPGTSARNIKIDINISQAPAGAEDVRLFRNGALVRVWRGDVLKGQNSVTLQTTLPIVAGENRITAYAFNRDDIKSQDALLNVNGSSTMGRRSIGYVLAIGVNSYANPEFDLRYAVADARVFSEEMKLRQTRLQNYSHVEVVSLTDAQATKANIVKALSELAGKIQPEDALIIYFAGHGIALNNRFYLIPHDLGYDGSRTKLDKAGLEGIAAHSISDQELESAVEGIDAGRLLMVIDACNSGQALESEEKRRGPMNSKGLAQLAYEKGMYILTAAQSYQNALEATRLGHGFLTYALVEEGLKTNAADRQPKDGQVLLREWLDFATARVPEIQEDDIKARELTRDKTKPVTREIQRPRLFYRRDAERYQLVVARP